MHITYFRGAKAKKPAGTSEYGSWADFEGDLEKLARGLPSAPPSADPKEQKLALLALAPYRLREGTTRENANVEAITALVLDVDRVPEELWPRLDEYAATGGIAIYESPSSTPSALRLRVLAPISREITPEECARTRYAFAELLGLEPGCGVQEAHEPARLFFAGLFHGDRPRTVVFCDGPPVDVDALLATPLAHDWTAKSGKGRASKGAAARGNASDESLAKARIIAENCEPSIEGHGGDAALFACARDLASVLGEDVDAIHNVLSETFNPRCLPAWDESKLRYEASRAAEGESNPIARATRRTAAKAANDTGAGAFGFASSADASDGRNQPSLQLDSKGTPYCTISNVVEILRYSLGQKLFLNDFTGRIEVTGVDRAVANMPDGAWTDAHSIALVRICEALNLRVSVTLAHSAVIGFAADNRRNPVADLLRENAATWDGTPRVDQAMTQYWGAADTDASRAASRVFLMGLAARGLKPGEKVDTALVLIGEQGTYKSSSLRALVGDDYFADSPLPVGSKDSLQNLRGILCWEFQENSSFNARDRDTIKAFLSAQVDTYRSSYARFAESVPRTCVFAITTNERQILHDPTGDRRYMPVEVGSVDVAAILRDRLQLLAEAAARVLCGESHYLTREELAALAPVKEAATLTDDWEDLIGAWLEEREHAPFTLAQLHDEITGAVPLAPKDRDRARQGRVTACLRRLGYERSLVRVGESAKRVRGWSRRATP